MNIRVTKALVAYTVIGLTSYVFLKRNLSETYLRDLAFEYHMNFTKRLDCP